MSLDFINNILTKYVKNAKCDNLIGEVKWFLKADSAWDNNFDDTFTPVSS